MLEIKTLQKSSIEEIIDCLLIAFENYFVQMPSDLNYWSARFRNAGFSSEHSWGVFDNDQLVGFILNAIGNQHQQPTAFNMGTGIIPAYRGQNLVDQMYEFGIPQLLSDGIRRCALEVITENHRAISTYKRIGFEQKGKLRCYKGDISPANQVAVVPVGLKNINIDQYTNQYSWENNHLAVQRAGDDYSSYLVKSSKSDDALGHFIINPKTGYIAQLESTNGDWQSIFDGIALITSTIKINNIHESRTDLIQFLPTVGLENHINQYYMDMDI